MTGKSEQVLIKTPQGINATRSGLGLSPRAYAMLKLFDGAMPVAEFKSVCMGASFSDGEFQATLDELVKFDHLRVVDSAAGAEDAKVRAAERRMLLTLDFTVNDVVPAAARAAVPAPAVATVAATAPATATAAVAATSTATAAASARVAAPAASAIQVARVAQPAAAMAMPLSAANEDAAREDKTAALKRETEIRQKLIATLQPRIEEELRARLRPKLEQELRPKLIAALRPGIEAELRTALTKELTPRVELELKARFAKTLAARKAEEDQAAPLAPAPALAPVVASSSAPVADERLPRLAASLSTPLFSLDKTGVCTYVSPAWVQFTGYETDDVVGHHLTDFFADKDRRAIAGMLTGVANGSALRFEQQGELRHKDGHGVWVELSTAPLTASSGETIGVCGALRDAAELRRATDQAEADGVRLLLLVEQIDTGVILEDGAGNIQQANPALCSLLSLDAAPYSLEGMPVAELLEMASKGFIGPEGFLRRMAQLRESGEDARGESFVMADGRVLQQDYLAVSANDATVGHLWLFREMRRAKSAVLSG